MKEETGSEVGFRRRLRSYIVRRDEVEERGEVRGVVEEEETGVEEMGVEDEEGWGFFGEIVGG